MGGDAKVSYEFLNVEQNAGALTVELARPDVLNALTVPMLLELKDVLEGEAAAPNVRAVLLTGAGRGFCAGADLSAELAQQTGDGMVRDVLERAYHPVVRAIASLEKPVVAGINGVAAGAGLSLALGCDYRLVAPDAWLTVGFAGIGLAVDAGGSYYLPRLVGLGRAMELAFSNRRVEASEAVRIGLADRLLGGDFALEARAEVATLAAGPTKALALIKRELRASHASTLEAQLALEATAQDAAAKTHDFREGVSAFAGKRKPRYTGE